MFNIEPVQITPLGHQGGYKIFSLIRLVKLAYEDILASSYTCMQYFKAIVSKSVF